MKILLNGATGGTNFGDFLFAKMFQDYVKEIVGEDSVYWYEGTFSLSDFYRKKLNYKKKYKLKDIDALVCISGGYFCGNDKRVRDYIIRYMSYFHIALKCILLKKPLAIIAVEVGKSKSAIINMIQKCILKKADLVIVRNEESLHQLRQYGIYNGICTTDSAHAISRDMFYDKEILKEIIECPLKKLFFHVQLSNIEVSYRLLPALNSFLKNHEEYCVVIGTDQYSEQSNHLLNEMAKKVVCKKVIVNIYDDPLALCKVLDNMDFIVTPKLHVGIVGATLNKSVVSFSIHKEKIVRFYNQLDESCRSLPMSEYDEDSAINIMETYHDKPLCVSNDILIKAKSNFEMLGDFLKKLQYNKR